MNQKHVLTENGWLNARDPARALTGVGKLVPSERLRRVAVAMIERVQDQLSEPICLQALELARQAVSGPVSAELLAESRSDVLRFLNSSRSLSPAAYSAHCATAEALRASALEAARGAAWEATKALARRDFERDGYWFLALRKAKHRSTSVVRDVLGNPFHPVRFDPRWRTSLVESTAMKVSKDFVLMPDLAEALTEAGCDEPAIRDHCNGPNLHVRGCWVIDLILAPN